MKKTKEDKDNDIVNRSNKDTEDKTSKGAELKRTS